MNTKIEHRDIPPEEKSESPPNAEVTGLRHILTNSMALAIGGLIVAAIIVWVAFS